jgi:putative DNA primase/helicase
MPRRDEQIVVGRFQEHAVAPYQFRAREDPSYYLRILTNRGERILWGKDLERAIAHSATQIKVGDLIGARRIGGQIVTVTTRQRDAQGRVIESSHPAHRHRWVVEKVQFFAERAKLARRVRDDQIDAHQEVARRPELVSTFLSLRGAEAIAERRIADPLDRERFLSLVREAMAKSVHQGEPLPAVRLRETPNDQKKASARDSGRERDERTR